MQWENFLEYLYTANLTSSYVAPWGSAPITLTSGTGAYTFGTASSDIIAASTITNDILVLALNISNASANADYEISLVYGASDTEFAQVGYQRSVATSQSLYATISAGPIPAGSRIRAFMRDSVGGSTLDVKIRYHKCRAGISS